MDFSLYFKEILCNKVFFLLYKKKKEKETFNFVLAFLLFDSGNRINFNAPLQDGLKISVC